MKIGVYDKVSGKLIYQTEVVQLAGTAEGLQDAFNDAWNCAVADGAVNAADRDKYHVYKIAVIGQ